MFKKILVPLDGSGLSEQVLPLVKELLEAGAEATLLAVAETPRATVQRRKAGRRPVPLAALPGAYPRMVVPAMPPVYVENRDQAIDRREHELLEYLEQVGRTLIEMECSVKTAVEFGEPAEKIVDFARREGFDLIVMATHGRSGLSERLHGSVTAEVIRSGVAPLLVVRPNEKRARPNR